MTCEGRGDVTSVMPPAMPDGRPLVLTHTAVKAGQAVTTGLLLAAVSGQPLIAFEADVPFYRDLYLGDSGSDVRQLEDALVRSGFLGSADDVFDQRTSAAMEELYAQAGVDASGFGAVDGRFSLSVAQSVPPGSAVLEVLRGQGDFLGPSDPILTISAASLELVCSAPSDIAVSVGDSLQLVVDGEPSAVTVKSVGAEEPKTQTREVVVTPDGEGLRPEGHAELHLVAEQTPGAVLTVPVGALFSSPDGDFEVRRVTSDGYEAVAVTPGMSAGGFIEVKAEELRESDEVQLHADRDPSNPSPATN